jgi:hypothetical protein
MISNCSIFLQIGVYPYPLHSNLGLTYSFFSSLTLLALRLDFVLSCVVDIDFIGGSWYVKLASFAPVITARIGK